ncbi:hypothetical protein [Burkholderia pyrrocinia]|uniref:Uncharacterized protein n=1 Tax=Burkholderia pyrrocinia TaxID=60550 RepID=A0ABZ3BW70_BURPY
MNRDVGVGNVGVVMKAALGGLAEQVADRRPGPRSRLTSTARNFLATRL